MAAALERPLAFERGGGAAQLQFRLAEREALHLGGFEQGREAAEQRASLALHQQPVGQQTGQIQIGQILTGIQTSVDPLETTQAEIVLLDLAEAGPELAVVLQGEILEIQAAQLGADQGAQPRTVQVEPQHLRLGSLPQPRLTGLLPAG